MKRKDYEKPGRPRESFAPDDKLYITGTNIQGVLDIQEFIWVNNVIFSGDLYYTGEGYPAADLELTATLVSAQQTPGNQVSVDGAGAVTVNYPTSAYCSSVVDAVQKYSWLTGTSTYAYKTFSLTQHTAFLNFEITFADGTASGSTVSAEVKNNSSTICTANVSTTTENEKVVAKFVLPVTEGTTLSSATVTMGTRGAMSISNATLAGKMYNVRKTQMHTLPAATTADVGMVVCEVGHLHAAKTAAPAGCTAVGILGKVSSKGHGLILALKDAPQEKWNTISEWSEVSYASTCLKLLPDDKRGGNLNSYTMLGSTPVSNWCVAEKSDYEEIFTNLGSTINDDGTTYDSNVNAFITGAGGSALSDYYWSATDYNDEYAWSFCSVHWANDPKSMGSKIRPVLGF